MIEKRPSAINFTGWKKVLYFFCVPAAVFALIVISRFPYGLRPAAVAATFSFTLVLPVVALGSYLVFRIPGEWGKVASLTWVSALLALTLAGLWASCQSNDQVLSGLLPHNDSTSYYVDALKLLDGGGFDAISARRPLAPVLFATLLGMCGRNLMAALALQTALNALSCWLAVRAVQRSHGAAAAALTLTVLFFYIRRYSGAITTEGVSISTGLVGFALLWSSIEERRFLPAAMGLATLSFALSTRPGAMFVLPFAGLWVIWQWREERSKLLLRGVWIAAALASGFAAHSLLFHLLAPPGSASNSNMPYLLYGVATGGTGWTQYLEDYPELIKLGEAERSQRVMALVIDEILQRPQNFIIGSLKQYAALFSDTYYSLYSFITYRKGWISPAVQWGLIGLSVVGLAGWLRRRTDAHLLLVLAFFAGIALSVPFAPPTDANRLRLFSATIILMAVMPAIGLHDVLKMLHLDRWVGLSKDGKESLKPGMGLSAALMALPVLAAVLLLSFAQPPQVAAVECPDGQTAAVVQVYRGSVLNIIPESRFALDWTPVVHQGRYRLFLHSVGAINRILEFEKLEAPMTLMVGPDVRSGARVWLAADPSKMPTAPALIGVCGYRASGKKILHAETVTVIQ